MEAIPAIRFPQLSCSSIRVFPQKSFRSQVHFPRKLFFFRSNSGESEIYGTSGVRTVSPSLLASEKEEAKAILTLFLKKQGLSNAVAVRTTNKSDLFINHLVFQLHSLHRSRYLEGNLQLLKFGSHLFPTLRPSMRNMEKFYWMLLRSSQTLLLRNILLHWYLQLPISSPSKKRQ